MLEHYIPIYSHMPTAYLRIAETDEKSTLAAYLQAQTSRWTHRVLQKQRRVPADLGAPYVP